VALEQALPRLSEMFASQGLTLADASVSREPPRDAAKSSAPVVAASINAIGGSDSAATPSTRISIGLVDTYV